MNFIKFFVAPLLALSLSATAMQQAPNIDTAYKLEPDNQGHLWIVSNFYQNGSCFKQETISAWKNEKGENEYFGFTTESNPLDKEYIKNRFKFYLNGHLRASDLNLKVTGLRLSMQINDEETDKKIAAANKKEEQDKLLEPNSGLTLEDQAYAEIRYEYFLEKSIQYELSCTSPMKL